MQNAKSELSTCATDKWDDAVHQLAKAINRQWALEEGLNAPLIGTASSRLSFAVLQAIPYWTDEVVVKMNELVSDYRLNEVARDLPAFNQKVSVLALTQDQGKAVELWRAGADALRPLWSVYKTMGTLDNDREFGPADVDEGSTNYWTGCVLSPLSSFGQAEAIAQLMASAAFGSDASHEYAPLSPFIFPALIGAELNFTTPRGADQRRAAIQPKQREGSGYYVTAEQTASYA
ncbi:hypothetical protein [Mycobacterium sp. NPDC050853]|uniref:hypothetical protein n=1 Tax=Mycobacterium sp. NPDC050853 TaxID=3155160 RepID=UPI0033DA5299